MIGISKERLLKIANETHDSDDTNIAVLSLLDMLINECHELGPWLPIDENTPKDKNFRLYCKQLGQKTGRIDEWSPGLFTHYQELPEDPETGD